MTIESADAFAEMKWNIAMPETFSKNETKIYVYNIYIYVVRAGPARDVFDLASNENMEKLHKIVVGSSGRD